MLVFLVPELLQSLHCRLRRDNETALGHYRGSLGVGIKQSRGRRRQKSSYQPRDESCCPGHVGCIVRVEIAHPVFLQSCLRIEDERQYGPEYPGRNWPGRPSKSACSEEQRCVHRMADPAIRSGGDEGAVRPWSGTDVEVSDPVVRQGPDAQSNGCTRK